MIVTISHDPDCLCDAHGESGHQMDVEYDCGHIVMVWGECLSSAAAGFPARCPACRYTYLTEEQKLLENTPIVKRNVGLDKAPPKKESLAGRAYRAAR